MEKEVSRLCCEDTDDLEWWHVPVVLLSEQLALDEVRAARDVMVDYFQPGTILS